MISSGDDILPDLQGLQRFFAFLFGDLINVAPDLYGSGLGERSVLGGALGPDDVDNERT